MRNGLFKVAAALVLSAAVSNAQSSSTGKVALPPSVTSPLEHGTLVLWFVETATPLERAQIAQRRAAATKLLPTTVQESTAGNYGQTASSVGQTAGSYGATPSQVGTNASNAGKPASEYGTPASNFPGSTSQAGISGQTTGNFGQPASNVGTPAGNYSTSTSANWGSDKRGSQVTQEERWTCTSPGIAGRRIIEWRIPGGAICGAFHSLQLRVLVVPDEDVADRLQQAEGTADFPDVIFGTQKLPWWNQSGYGMTMLGWPVYWIPVLEPPGVPERNRFQWALGPPVMLRKAQHMEVAESFVVWLRDEMPWIQEKPEKLTDDDKRASQVATVALGSMLEGGGLSGVSDEQAAVFDSQAAQREALMPSPPDLPEGLNTRIAVLHVEANARLAVVLLRGIVWSPQSFGVVDALAVLRKNSFGSWNVLQMTPNLWREDINRLADSLIYPVRSELKPVNAVSQASPVDNDVRSPGTELWWDNDGSAIVQVVEWQIGGETRWSNPHLFPVPDRSPRTRTRVLPDFTRVGGKYRWRVWSVGSGGMMAFTPWRNVTIMP